jgi:hypothetical protein
LYSSPFQVGGLRHAFALDRSDSVLELYVSFSEGKAIVREMNRDDYGEMASRTHETNATHAWIGAEQPHLGHCPTSRPPAQNDCERIEALTATRSTLLFYASLAVIPFPSPDIRHNQSHSDAALAPVYPLHPYLQLFPFHISHAFGDNAALMLAFSHYRLLFTLTQALSAQYWVHPVTRVFKVSSRSSRKASFELSPSMTIVFTVSIRL